MDLNLTEAENRLREKVRNFVRDALPEPIRAKISRNERPSVDDLTSWYRILRARGWIGSNWPVRFGGPGWSPVQQYVFEEELAVAGAPLPPAFGTKLVGPVIMTFGSGAQQGYFLPRILSGEHWWCQGYSEPGAGSDLASLRTRAVREGDHYIVNGQKTWTTLAQYANWIFCLVRTDPQAKSQRGISFLLIDMASAGVSVRPIITLDGAHEVNEVWFENVRVPAENLVGEENHGWTYAKFLLQHERSTFAGVGHIKRDLERLKAIAAAERRCGRALIEEPLFAAKISQVEIDLMALEITGLRLLDAARSQTAPGPVVSILKVQSSVIQQRLSELLLEAVGIYGLPFVPERERGIDTLPGIVPARAAGLAAKYCNERKLSIFGGSNEIQKNIIARMILGF
ncbi:MAG: acyl-CoA dehydrogenase family protein [Steroidobacteraceae bacterium]